MLTPPQYCTFMSQSEQNRSLMARVALNAVGHPKEFPVDINELRKLSPINRAIVNGLLNWCAANRHLCDGTLMLPEVRKFLA